MAKLLCFSFFTFIISTDGCLLLCPPPATTPGTTTPSPLRNCSCDNVKAIQAGLINPCTITVNSDGTPASFVSGCTCMFTPYDWAITESGPPNAPQYTVTNWDDGAWGRNDDAWVRNDDAWVRNDGAWVRNDSRNVIAVRRRSGFELDGR
ncbi:hypothetical protein FO519_004191 [Halicephalobus sp. NKZ332]|nr:hypothetical protein FO519_004191 [Halicephalobus sp. NKZ332]